MENLTDAVPEYIRAIDLYADEGLFENGIAVCKKIMRLSPDKPEVYFNLANLYAEIGLFNEAMDSLTTYLEFSKERVELRREADKYKKLMLLLVGADDLKSKLKEIYTEIDHREDELDKIFNLAPKEVKSPSRPAGLFPAGETILSKGAGLINQAPTEAINPKETAEISDLSTAGAKPEIEEAHETEEAPAVEELVVSENPEVLPVGQQGGDKLKLKDLPPDRADSKTGAEPLTEEKEIISLLHTIKGIKESDAPAPTKDHYKLGMEYSKLDFYGAAIREFQLATCVDSYRLGALKQLGYCLLEQQDAGAAIHAFKRALKEEEKTADDAADIHYGLGRAYELLNNNQEAINAFEEVYLYNVDYKDIKERLKKLKGQE